MSPEFLQQVFKFKPLQTAKVSEISEATAAASIPQSKRINFHIGNPVQDESLAQLYHRLVTRAVGNSDIDFGPFFEQVIQAATVYAPRGGYHSRNVHPLLNKVRHWAAEEQSDSMIYHLGAENKPREIIVSSGGIYEILRILFHTLSRFQQRKPVFIHLHNMEIPEYLQQFPELKFRFLETAEQPALLALQAFLKEQPSEPHYFISGKIGSETFRRKLSALARTQPLFFVEANESANKESLAREAQLAQRVLRILSPQALNAQITSRSTSFLLGPANLIQLLETMHFELKGTPSAPEMNFISHLLDSKLLSTNIREIIDIAEPGPEIQTDSSAEKVMERNSRFVARLEEKATKIQNKYQQLLYRRANQARSLSSRLHSGQQSDPFANFSANELLRKLIEQSSQDSFTPAIEQSLISAFIGHHPFYHQESCMLVSGSARTALSLLGFHCSISEVVTVDLSWTYQHCFPQVHTVALKNDLNLDLPAILNTVKTKLQKSNNWLNHGAVILNNPHNATGIIFSEPDLKELLRQLLNLNIRVIDDLSYQNVRPEYNAAKIKTLKELVLELQKDGYVTRAEANRLSTVHSLSKTDSFAGARLAIVEIPEEGLRNKFERLNQNISKNDLSILLAYLFYRNSKDAVAAFWQMRNKIFSDRMQAIQQAADNLPKERNPFGIQIHAPQGSMYPRLEIARLPQSLSLDWLATQFATEGTGLIPLSTFAKTAAGFRLARNSFRLTLGGNADPQKLATQTRRVIIDLNRFLALESTKYIRTYNPSPPAQPSQPASPKITTILKELSDKAIKQFSRRNKIQLKTLGVNSEQLFKKDFLPWRLSIFQKRFEDYLAQKKMLANLSLDQLSRLLLPNLQAEFYKDNLQNRSTQFKNRLFDRTVHPTQMYSLKVDLLFQELLENFEAGLDGLLIHIPALAAALCDEFLGKNISISSVEEGAELLMDLHVFGRTETQLQLTSASGSPIMLSFWGDWDGSTRPSGQGHRLVAAVLLENIRQMIKLLDLINLHYPQLKIDPDLMRRIRRQPSKNQQLWDLFNRITALTAKLEGRHRNLVRLDFSSSYWQRLGRRLHLLKDPIELQWQHNDRLERKMKSLRLQRKKGLNEAFALNKQLRKTIYQLLPEISRDLHDPILIHRLATYHDLLKRFVLTPRIHQKMITSDDSFAIDTTVFNINEINEIGAAYGNPGLIMGLQISMSDTAGPLIDLERKLSGGRLQILQKDPALALPNVWPIPLFEEASAVLKIEHYLDHIWQYSERSKSLQQSTASRFSEIICEVFFAGSDLSQQVSQPKAADLYAQAKYLVYRWLGKKGLTNRIRIKLGSGEPMQRQGGYYDPRSGQSAFVQTIAAKKRWAVYLSEPDQICITYASSPLRGILANGDLRTFQSNLMEHIRLLSVSERAALISQIRHNQAALKQNIKVFSEPLNRTRLEIKSQNQKALKLLSTVNDDIYYRRFLELNKTAFRNILYGNKEDVLGIHIVSYFISRVVPALRDRPTVRPTTDAAKKTGLKVVDRIAQTLPLSEHGTMLRAIGHSRAQTMILGISQLSTGLFRAIENFCSLPDLPTDPLQLLRNNIMPRLPVYEILHNLRLFQDRNLDCFGFFDSLFPSWNSAIITLREDRELMRRYIPLLQKELVRKLGLNTNAFFEGDVFNPHLLPTLKPDLAVLLQKDLFHDDPEMLAKLDFNAEPDWLNEMFSLLEMPLKIRSWRLKIWELLKEPIFEQVKSFNKLAYAITGLAQSASSGNNPALPFRGRANPLSGILGKALLAESDERMKEFLENSVKYLSGLQAQSQEVPINIIRALRDVERIVKIEQQPLLPEKQSLLAFYILQIARLAGENG